jgi:hypothetical protein
MPPTQVSVGTRRHRRIYRCERSAAISANDRSRPVRECLAVVIVALFVAVSVSAQIAPPRTLEELKRETQSRVDGNLVPAGGA